MIKKDKWISNKISTLIKKEGKTREQAIAQALSMAERIFQQGGKNLPTIDFNSLDTPEYYKSTFISNTPTVPIYKIDGKNYEVSRLGTLHPEGTLKSTIFGAVTKDSPLASLSPEQASLMEIVQNKANPNRSSEYLFNLNKGWVVDNKGNRIKRIDIPDFKEIYKQDGGIYQQGGEKEYYQQGNDFYFKSLQQTPNLNFQIPNNQLEYNPNNYTNPLSLSSLNAGEMFKENNPLPQGIFENQPNVEQQTPQKTVYQDTNRVNIVDPTLGVSLDYALNFAGRGFGAKNPTQALIGSSLSAIKGARNFLSGFSEAKESNRVAQEMYNNRFNTPVNYNYLQQGGSYKNSDILAKEALVNNPNGDANLEDGEYVMRNSGKIQPVIGEPHIKNGKIADGVNVDLNNGDKVLSDYLKLRPQDIKELKNRYNLSVKKGTTFAQAQKKLDNKLGITKLESEKAKVFEKIEKVSQIKDQNTKELSLNTLNKQVGDINQKIDELEGKREEQFNNLFDMQESQPKKDTSKLYDKNGKEVEEEVNNFQQGDEIKQLAKKHGLSEDRAIELLKMQQGGGIPDRYKEMGFSKVGQKKNSTREGKKWMVLAKKGEDYKVVHGGAEGMEDFSQHGSEERKERFWDRMGGKDSTKAKDPFSPLYWHKKLGKWQQGGEVQQEELLQFIVQSLQTGSQPEDVLQELVQIGIPQEQGIQIIQEILSQQEVGDSTEMLQQGGYSFSTRYSPELKGYDVTDSSVLNQDILSDVELMQPYTGKGYGAKMADVEETIKVHDWYFNTEDKKQKFREAVLKQGEQPEVLAFQEAYNQELKKRGKEAGLSDTDINNVINNVGFSDKGVQLLDGKFGAFTSTRPLYSFKKTDTGDIETDIEQTPIVEDINVQQRDVVKNVFPNFLPYIPNFSPLQPIAKQEVAFQRQAPIKQTIEPMLAEQERQRLTDVERIQQTGLAPQQQEALLAQGLASSQMAANEAISRVENYNAQNQFQTDQYNLQTASKEQLLNNQLNADYQDKVMASLANQEESIRNMYRTQFLQAESDRNYITNLNKINTLSDQFAITPNGVEYLNNQSYFSPVNRDYINFVEEASPQERENIKSQYIANKRKQAMLGLKR